MSLVARVLDLYEITKNQIALETIPDDSQVRDHLDKFVPTESSTSRGSSEDTDSNTESKTEVDSDEVSSVSENNNNPNSVQKLTELLGLGSAGIISNMPLHHCSGYLFLLELFRNDASQFSRIEAHLNQKTSFDQLHSLFDADINH
jgi:hypothetical protein